ncbi:HD domain-containing phosphohydrolase [Candidatus Omnitrophota bacterium]
MTKEKFYLEPSTADKLGICLFKYQLSPKEMFLAFNHTLTRITGSRTDNNTRHLRFKSLFKSTRDANDFFKNLKDQGTVRFYETLFKRKGKKDVWVAITASLVTSGKKSHIEGILEDVTKHRELEEKFTLERELFQSLLDNLPDAVYFKDNKNRLIRVNRFYADGFKLPPEKIIGKTDFDFFPKDQAQKMFDDDAYVLKTGKPIIGKIERTLLPNGTLNCVTTTKIPLNNKKGIPIGTMGITRDITNYDKVEQSRLSLVMNSLKVLDKVLEIKDPYTFGHTRRVSMIAERIAKELGWDDNRILELKITAELHDIGKILIPLEILNKPGKLSTLELSMIREHVERCHDMLKPHTFPFPLSEAIYQHHERLDGKGYPRGLSAKDIIPEARVLAVSDVLEAMTFHRPYRAALGIKKALKEIKDNAGSKYDQKIVKTALKLIEQKELNPFWLNQESTN